MLSPNGTPLQGKPLPSGIRIMNEKAIESLIARRQGLEETPNQARLSLWLLD